MIAARSVRSRLALVVATLGLSLFAERAGVATTLSTRAGDLTVIQTVVHVSPGRRARLQRIRGRIDRPRALPRALTRQVTSALVVVAAAGELAPGTFVASVVFVNRANAPAGGGGSGRGTDLEDRIARAAVARLLGVQVRKKSRRVIYERAPGLLSTPVPASFCTNALPADLVTALTSPVLHVEAAPIVPWLPGSILRSALGLAYRACDQPLPELLVSADIDRFVDDFVAPSGTTTTTLPEECHDTATLEAKTLTDPAYPGCTEVEWITPIPDCADDLDFELVDVATGQPIGSEVFGHTMLVTAYFGLNPIRLVVRACNGEAGSPGGATLMLYPIVSWGG